MDTIKKYSNIWIKIFHDAFIIGIFSMFFSGLTAFVHVLTYNNIKHIEDKKTLLLLNDIIKLESYDSTILKEKYLIKYSVLGDDLDHSLWIVRKHGRSCAIIVETTAPNGYSGMIKMLVGFDLLGNILGVRVVSHHETPGLGDYIDINISKWINVFSGMNLLNSDDHFFAIKKDGGVIDQFTGATITPRAVVSSIKNTVLFLLHSIKLHILVDSKGNKIYVNK
ncbi:MAG: electron transport complex subunit RsxG [Buchnera aphidicola (Eriosoma harunire)]